LIFGDNIEASLLIILNLILIEALLSIDNATALAALVMDLPESQRPKALRIGVFFAYVFRGLSLFFASKLIKISWLKLIAAIYLIYLCIHFFADKRHRKKNPHESPKKNRLYRMLLPVFGPFWTIVILVEMLDLVFSLDNVFAAVVYAKDNIYLIWIGVFIGIITMRLVAVVFVKMMSRFPLLNTSAFIVVGLLGLKLLVSFCSTAFGSEALCAVVENEKYDFVFSACTLLVFLIPIIIGLINGKNQRGKQ
jgi:YkoY family integral membrane protein